MEAVAAPQGPAWRMHTPARGGDGRCARMRGPVRLACRQGPARRAPPRPGPRKEGVRVPASAYRSEFEILEVLPVGIFILDRSLRVAFVNETMERYFGISRSRLIGRYKPALVQDHIRHI